MAGAIALALAVGGAAAVNASSLGDGESGGSGARIRGVPFGGTANSAAGQTGGTGLVAAPANSLHGEFVTANGSGGYQTMRMQSGQLTAVDDAAVTVRSADDFTATYTVTGDTVIGAAISGSGQGSLDDLDVGDTVSVTATVADSASAGSAAATATTIVESDASGGAAQGQQGQGQWGQGQVPGQGQWGQGQVPGQGQWGQGQVPGQGQFQGQVPGGGSSQADPTSQGGGHRVPPAPPGLAGPGAQVTALAPATGLPERGRGGAETGTAIATA